MVSKLASMRIVSGRQKAQADVQSKTLIKKNKKGLAEAEVYVGVFQRVLQVMPYTYNRTVKSELKERGRIIEDDDIERVWSELIFYRKEWERLAVGDSIGLEWPNK